MVARKCVMNSCTLVVACVVMQLCVMEDGLMAYDCGSVSGVGYCSKRGPSGRGV